MNDGVLKKNKFEFEFDLKKHVCLSLLLEVLGAYIIWFEFLSQLSKWIKVWEISRGWMQNKKKGYLFINVARQNCLMSF